MYNVESRSGGGTVLYLKDLDSLRNRYGVENRDKMKQLPLLKENNSKISRR